MRPINTRNITFDTVQRLGLEIVSGKYTTDKPFPTEAALCEEYEISRSVMREAIKIVTSKGLLSARPGRGTTITDEKHWSMLDSDVLYWLLKREASVPLLIEFTMTRIGVEPEAAWQAAQNITEQQKVKLLDAVGELEKAFKGESDPLESDILFHLAVLEASNNRFLTQMDSLIETALRFSIRLLTPQRGFSITSVEDHRKVADAILAGNSSAARAYMRSMLKDTLRHLNELKKSNSS